MYISEKTPLVTRNSSWQTAPILKVLMIVVLTAGITETLFRTILGLGNPVLLQFDRKCGYIIKPNQDIVRFFCHIRINSYGMRSEEVPSTKPNGTLRILFVGDSVTYGTTHVDQRQIFTQILQRELPSEIHHPVQVLNASANSWAPSNEAAYLKSRGLFNADLILMVINDKDLVQSFSTLRQLGTEAPTEKPKSALGEIFYRYIKPKFTENREPVDPDSIAFRPQEFKPILDTLADIRGFVLKRQSRLAVAYLPFRSSTPKPMQYSAPLALTKWCLDNKVPLLDLTPALSSSSLAEVTIRDRIHPNTLGNRLIANTLEREWSLVSPN